MVYKVSSSEDMDEVMWAVRNFLAKYGETIDMWLRELAERGVRLCDDSFNALASEVEELLKKHLEESGISDVEYREPLFMFEGEEGLILAMLYVDDTHYIEIGISTDVSSAPCGAKLSLLAEDYGGEFKIYAYVASLETNYGVIMLI